MIHHSPEKTGTPGLSGSAFPDLGCVGGTPTPKKRQRGLGDDRQPRSPMVPITSTGPMTLGRIWVMTMRAGWHPDDPQRPAT